MRSERSPFIRLAVEADRSVFVQAYTNTERNNIRIRFDEGGFIPDGVFRYVIRAMDNPSIVPPNDPKTKKLPDGRIQFLRGPVTIIAKDDRGDITMEAEIRLPDGSGKVRKTLSVETCDEIGVRLRQVDAILDTYVKLDPDEESYPRRSAPKAGVNGASHPSGLVARST